MAYCTSRADDIYSMRSVHNGKGLADRNLSDKGREFKPIVTAKYIMSFLYKIIPTKTNTRGGEKTLKSFFFFFNTLYRVPSNSIE